MGIDSQMHVVKECCQPGAMLPTITSDWVTHLVAVSIAVPKLHLDLQTGPEIVNVTVSLQIFT